MKIDSLNTETRNILIAIIACCLMTLLATPLRQMLDDTNIVMLFLLVVVVVSVKLGRSAGVVAAICSVGLFDVFFVEPRFSFSVSDAQYVVTFTVMLSVALVITSLTSHLREQMLSTQTQASQSQALYEFAKTLSGCTSVTQVADASEAFLKRALALDVVLVLPNQAEMLEAQGNIKLNNVEMITARSAYDSQHITEMGYNNDGDHSSTYFPLQGSTRLRGVMVVRSSIEMTHCLIDSRDMLEAMASIVAITIERLHFIDIAHHSLLQINNERLRSSILSALSHDIRTPLTTLYGLADGLHFVEPRLSDAVMTTADTLCTQVLQLNTMVTNLLDMAKLKTGVLALHQEWQPLEEVIGASIKLMKPSLQSHTVKVSLPEDLPLLNFDAVLMERVFCNLLENAAKYADGDSSPITIEAQIKDSHVCVAVENKGQHIPSNQLKTIFELFERGHVESNIHGTGVGLSICQNIVHYHEGKIWAENTDTGVRITFSLPLGSPPITLPEESDT